MTISWSSQLLGETFHLGVPALAAIAVTRPEDLSVRVGDFMILVETLKQLKFCNACCSSLDSSTRRIESTEWNSPVDRMSGNNHRAGSSDEHRWQADIAQHDRSHRLWSLTSFTWGVRGCERDLERQVQVLQSCVLVCPTFKSILFT